MLGKIRRISCKLDCRVGLRVEIGFVKVRSSNVIKTVVRLG